MELPPPAGVVPPLPAHVGRPGTAPTLALARRAVADGAAAVAAVVPYYYAAGDDAIRGHYGALIEGAGAPVYAYTIPSHTHRELEPALLERLIGDGLAGCKDSTKSAERHGEYQAAVEAVGTPFALFTGTAGLVLEALRGGSAGAVLALANVHPEPCVALARAARPAGAGRRRALSRGRHRVRHLRARHPATGPGARRALRGPHRAPAQGRRRRLPRLPPRRAPRPRPVGDAVAGAVPDGGRPRDRAAPARAARGVPAAASPDPPRRGDLHARPALGRAGRPRRRARHLTLRASPLRPRSGRVARAFRGAPAARRPRARDRAVGRVRVRPLRLPGDRAAG